MAGISWPALVAGARARASDVEAKFAWIEGNIVPMNDGGQTDASYDLGTTAARWRSGYFSTRVNAPAFGLSDTTFMSFEQTNTAMKLTNGVGVNEFSNDTTLAGNSDLAVPTEKAVKTYVDGILTPGIFRAVLLSNTTLDIPVTSTAIQFSPVSDPYNEMTGSVFTAATTGTYEINFRQFVVQNAAGPSAFAYLIGFKKNDSLTTVFPHVNSTYVGTTGSTNCFLECDDHYILSMTSGDTLKIYYQQAGFGSPTLSKNDSGLYWYGSTITTHETYYPTELTIHRI